MLIISLSTIPPRFELLGPTLKSLLNQKTPADRIILYIPNSYRRFPDYDGRLPDVPDGVEIRRPEIDYGPATKVLAAAREFRGQDCDILFCDDDRVYPSGWSRVFLDARQAHPNACIAIAAREGIELFDNTQDRGDQPRAVQHDWRRDLPFLFRYGIWSIRRKLRPRCPRPLRVLWKSAGYTDLLKGYGGVLVRPEFFDDVAYDIPDVLWAVDDIWLSGMLARNGIPIWTPANVRLPVTSRASDAAALDDSVIDGARRRAAEEACAAYLRETYGIWA